MTGQGSAFRSGRTGSDVQGLFMAAAASAIAAPAGPVHTVTSQAEFDAVIAANTNVELSGATIRIAGGLWSTMLQLPGGMSFAPRLNIVGVAGHKLPGLRFGQGILAGVNFVGLKIQHQNWPATGACVQFQSATTIDDLTFDRCEIWHGYGAGLAQMNEGTIYPEYARTSNVVDVGLTPQTVALNWRDGVNALGSIQFFNRGSLDVEVRLGASPSAAAAASPTTCQPGRKPFLGADPSTAAYMHISCPTASGGQTVQCNARTEQGMAEYLASAFSSSGSGSTTGDVEFRDCHLHDLATAFKFLPPIRGHLDLFRNRTQRIYGDVIAQGFPEDPDSKIAAASNFLDMPFCRSGLPENQNGDAGDPHGDIFQLYNKPPPALPSGEFVFVDNVVGVPANLRLADSVGNQGGVYCDESCGYRDCYVVGNVLLLNDGGSNAITFSGQSRADYIYVAGNVAFAADNPNANGGRVDVPSSATEMLGRSFIAGNIVNKITLAQTAGFENIGLLDNVTSDGGPAMTSLVADAAGLRTATTAAQVRAKCAGVGAALGRGLAYVASAIDVNADRASGVLLYEKLHPGVTFQGRSGRTAGATVTSEIAKVLGGGAAMPVTITGGQYQITADQAGTTVLQAWTSSPGVISRGQFVQVRATASGVSGATVTITLTIDRGTGNGGPVSTQVAYTTA